MLPTNNWQVTRAPNNPFLVQLNADSSLVFVSVDQARKIAAALLKVADAVEKEIK